jgi:uncharacterized circularly permuted ATP-grasp superfamily protein
MKPRFDEMHAADTSVREHYRVYDDWLQRQPPEMMKARREEAEMIFRRVGITFAVYGAKDEDGAGTERLIPFDLIPRVIPKGEWVDMEAGLRQRVTALNRFIHDVYHGQEILKAGIVPAEQVLNNAQFRKEMMGVDVPGGIYSHISGIDIVRAPNIDNPGDGTARYYVLEDNLRVPSGVSYMLENRKMTMRLFPELFSMHRVAPVAHYPDLLLETLRAVAPAGVNEPQVVVLTPGMYNSAYFEHAFLAQQMGVELVEGQDLFVQATASSTCARRRARAGWTWSTAASTTTSWTPWPSVPTARWAVPACWMSTAPATSRCATPSAPASPTTRASIRTCRR